jgi:hypothetical protein
VLLKTKTLSTSFFFKYIYKSVDMTFDRKKVRVFNPNFREHTNMANVYIFDIDGCIMPNLFQNFGEDVDELPSFKDAVTNLRIFPEFLDFYKRNCANSLAVYFITGRTRKEYGRATQRQLRPLKQYQAYLLKFYPNDKPHVKKEYFKWKYDNITQIIGQHRIDAENIHIYDDFEDIIFQLREIRSLKFKVHCNLIRKQKDWLLDQIPIL